MSPEEVCVIAQKGRSSPARDWVEFCRSTQDFVLRTSSRTRFNRPLPLRSLETHFHERPSEAPTLADAAPTALALVAIRVPALPGWADI
jgi:hypothetical protein